MDDAIAVLKALDPLVATIPVAGPGVQGLLAVATHVCEVVKQTKANREEYEKLAKDVAGYTSAVSKAVQSDPQFSPGSESASGEQQRNTTNHIDELKSVFQQVADTIKNRKYEDGKREGKLLGGLRQDLYRIRKKAEDEERIKELRSKIEKSIEFFHLGAHVHELSALKRIENEMKAISEERRQDRLRQEQDKLEREVAEEAKAARETEDRRRKARKYMEKKLTPVFSALFDANGTPDGCLPRTREKLLEEIYRWVSDDSPSSADVFCVTGLAGTGKTTIAQSVCIYYSEKRPGASFIITRFSADRRNPTKILHSIVYQLGLSRRAYKKPLMLLFTKA